MRVFRACIILFLFSIIDATGRKPPTYSCQANERHCGDNKCCCTVEKARCENIRKKLYYIPKLPSTITTIDFNNNYLPYVSAETLRNVTLNLKQLYLTDNDIINIAYDTFTRLPNLTLLDLSKNQKLDKDYLKHALGGLQKSQPLTLRLQNISLQSDLAKIFSQMQGSRIKKIDISKNLIDRLNLDVFSMFDYLKTLYVNNCNIVQVLISQTLKSLEFLSLTDNAISRSLPNFCSRNTSHHFISNLYHLDLSGNYIAILKSEPISCLQSLLHLNLGRNVITKFPANVFSNLHRLEILDIHDMKETVKIIERYAFNCSSLRSLRLTGDKIKFTAEQAFNIFQGCENVVNLYLGHNDMGSLKEEHIIQMFNPLPRLEELYLVAESLQHIPQTLFGHFPNLTKLDLDGNSISDIDNIFDNVTSLQSLVLQTNKIRVLTEKSFPSNLRQCLKVINLGNNPFSCTCEMLWFRTWIGDNKTVGQIKLAGWPSYYRCATPADMKDKWFKDYYPTKQSCTPKVYHDFTKIVIAVAGSIVFVMVLVSLIGYRYRWYIRYWFYKTRRDKIDPEQHSLLNTTNSDCYDGYVVYSDEDAQFVHNDLLNLVEEKHGNKLHVWHRDAENGGKIEVMMDAIYNSKNVLVVLSSNFLRESWCKFQLDVALDRQVELKRDFVMLITLEDIDYKALSTYWCVVLTKYKVAEWCMNQNDVKRRVLEQALLMHFDK